MDAFSRDIQLIEGIFVCGYINENNEFHNPKLNKKMEKKNKMVNPVQGLVQTLNLDEYDDPEFSVIIKGKKYICRVYSLQDILDATKFHRKLDEDFAKDSIDARSPEAAIRMLVYYFPGMSEEILRSIHISKLMALSNEIFRKLGEYISMSMDDLENFKKGKVDGGTEIKTKVETEPETKTEIEPETKEKTKTEEIQIPKTKTTP